MFFEALKGYKQVNRDVMVPFKWKVPHSSPWPEVMHGYELGEGCPTDVVQLATDSKKEGTTKLGGSCMEYNLVMIDSRMAFMI